VVGGAIAAVFGPGCSGSDRSADRPVVAESSDRGGDRGAVGLLDGEMERTTMTTERNQTVVAGTHSVPVEEFINKAVAVRRLKQRIGAGCVWVSTQEELWR